LVGKQQGDGSARFKDDTFIESTYARRWKELLHSDELRRLANKHRKDIVFSPHPVISMYLSYFDIPSHITLRNAQPQNSLQHSFARSAMLITDYSSVAFDVAYIDKPV